MLTIGLIPKTRIIATLCAGIMLATSPVMAQTTTRPAIGDGKVSTTPTIGYVYSCAAGGTQGGGQGGMGPGGGQGANTAGPWILGDGTWDPTAKITVQGAVEWPQAKVSIALQGDKRVITTNSLPANHTTGIYPIASADPAYQFDRNPNAIAAQQFVASLPATPQASAQPNCIGMGPIGVATNGVAIFNGLDAQNRDAVAWEIQDSCGGHPERSGMYHYHGRMGCLETDHVAAQHSALVGYAFDGFGIFGLFGENGVELTNYDLDVCHGHTHAIEWDGKQVELYHYHLTGEYPYTIGCYHGTAISVNGGGNGGGPNNGRPPGPPPSGAGGAGGPPPRP